MSIEFIPAICPKCGGELRVPTNIDKVNCMYCGMDIIVHYPNKVLVTDDFDVQKSMIMAKSALKGKNFNEAYSIFSKILDHDLQNTEAWIGKGYAAGMLSTYEHPRLEEFDECLVVKGLLHGEMKKPISIINEINEPQIRSEAAEYLIGVAFHLSDLVRPEKFRYGLPTDYAQKCYDLDKSKLHLVCQAVGIMRGCKSPYSETSLKEWILSLAKSVHSSSLCLYPNLSEDVRSITKSVASWDLEMGGYFEDKIFKSSFEAIFKTTNEKKDDCFIATATYGDPHHPDVMVLRRYRDNCLSKNHLGRLFVKLYYFFSPPLAKVITSNKTMQRMSYRYLVRKWVAFANKALGE